MAIRMRNRVIGAVLVIAAAAGLWRASAVEQEKRRLASAYRAAQAQIAQLSEERAKLSGELTGARQTVEGQTASLAQLQGDLDRVQRQLEDTTQELASLEQEHQALRAEHLTLASQFESVQHEKQQLEATLSDIHQLTLAIRDVRHKIWEQRFAALRTRWQERVATLERQDEERLASGNRGYVLHEGLSTIGQAPTPRLHVHVLEPRAE